VREVVIENPVINSAFAEPSRHFEFDADGITDEIVESRRLSSYFVPIAQPKKKGKQLIFDTEWTQDRVEENKFINDVRQRVSDWRAGGHVGVTKTSRLLLEHWTSPGRERRLFFCQIEALETAIFLAEIAPKTGHAWIENQLRAENDHANAGLYRIAFKMATGSGKTVVMAMLIAWQALNKFADPKDAPARPSCRPSSKVRSIASTATTRNPMSFGNRCVTRRSRPATGLTAPTSLRRSLSSFATTPTSASWSTTGSRDGRSAFPVTRPL
jgi:hypothetical protein